MDFDTFKKHILETSTQMFNQEGRLPATITLLHVDSLGDPSLSIVPISHLMGSDESKDIVTEKILPQIMESLKEKGESLVCVCLSSEVWIRKTKDPIGDEWKNLPKTEAVFHHFESDFSSLDIVIDIVVGDDGKKCFGEVTELKSEGSTGRFTNLLRKYSRVSEN